MVRCGILLILLSTLVWANEDSNKDVKNDTIYVVRDTANYREVGLFGKLRSLRQRGYGLTGGFGYGVSLLSNRPVRNLVKNIAAIDTISFSWDDKKFDPFIITRGFGYGGFGGGVRLGGGGAYGKSDIAYGMKDSGEVSLNIEMAYGGFLVSKNISYQKVNFNFGSYFGAGEIEVDGFYTPQNNTTARWKMFTSSAYFIYLEPFSEVTYSIISLFHVGIQVSALSNMSIDGFTHYGSDFFSVNPAFTVKFIFGNLG